MKMKMKKHPLQPLELDKENVLRFKRNKIVEYLLDNGGIDLNRLAVIDFSQEDREQFAQLIGYSLAGFGSLAYVSDGAYETARIMYEENRPELEARNASLIEQLGEVKNGLRLAAVAAFGIHPDDLM